MKTRRKYTSEFKAGAVRQVQSRGTRTVQELAESLGVTHSLLHDWRKKGAPPVVTDRGESPEQELHRLRRENAELKRDREALLKSTAVAVRTRP